LGLHGGCGSELNLSCAPDKLVPLLPLLGLQPGLCRPDCLGVPGLCLPDLLFKGSTVGATAAATGEEPGDAEPTATVPKSASARCDPKDPHGNRPTNSDTALRPAQAPAASSSSRSLRDNRRRTHGPPRTVSTPRVCIFLAATKASSARASCRVFKPEQHAEIRSVPGTKPCTHAFGWCSCRDFRRSNAVLSRCLWATPVAPTYTNSCSVCGLRNVSI
jgi:hypothetical protein